MKPLLCIASASIFTSCMHVGEMHDRADRYHDSNIKQTSFTCSRRMLMSKIHTVVLAILILCNLPIEQSIASTGDTLRIATYNLLNFPGTDPTGRIPYFRTVVTTMKPDILVVQEMQSEQGVTTFLNDVMNASGNGSYTSVVFHNGPDTDNGIFFRTDKVLFVRDSYLNTSPRHIAEYVLQIVATGEELRLYSLHFKAGTADTSARLNEATVLRNYLNALPLGSKFVVAGDFNIYRSTEPAFQKLLRDEGNNNGRLKDPLNAVGVWNNNYAFRYIHTQSPRVRSFGGGSTGGMDDRFDMILTSYALDQSLIVSSYTAYGNDGNHFNDSINRLPNYAVPDSVANALHYAADHIPAYADFVFTSITSVRGELPGATFVLEQNYPNPFNPSTTIRYSIGGQQHVRLSIFDALGRKVATLVDHEQYSGTHEVVWDASNIAAGMFFYRLQTEEGIRTKSMVLVK